MRPLISKETAIQINNTLIVRHISIITAGLRTSDYLSDKPQKLQNRAASVITKLPFDTNSNHLLTTHNWERLYINSMKETESLNDV